MEGSNSGFLYTVSAFGKADGSIWFFDSRLNYYSLYPGNVKWDTGYLIGNKMEATPNLCFVQVSVHQKCLMGRPN